MGEEYPRLREDGIDVIVLAPDPAEQVAAYWKRQALPFRAASDLGGATLRALGQKVRWSRLGRLPAVIAVAPGGRIVAAHYGESMRDVGDTASLAARLREARADGKE